MYKISFCCILNFNLIKSIVLNVHEYTTFFRNWEFFWEESSSDGLKEFFQSLISYPNFFEFIGDIHFESTNDSTIYDDLTENKFKYISLIDLMLSFEMGAHIFVYQKYLTFIIWQHIEDDSNIHRRLEINNVWDIELLDNVKRNKRNQGISSSRFKYNRRFDLIEIERFRSMYQKDIKLILNYEIKGKLYY